MKDIRASRDLKAKATAFLVAATFAWSLISPQKAIADTLWTQKDDGMDDGEWFKVKYSSDGTRLFGIFYNYTDNLYHIERSFDNGDSWSEITPNDFDVPDEDEFDSASAERHIWSDVDISEDGTSIILSDSNGVNGHSYVWYSPNSGSSWIRLNDVGQLTTGYWSAVALEDNILMATDGTHAQQIFTSTDYGNTWQDVTPVSEVDWSAIALSANGNYMVASESSVAGYIFLSEDQGATWNGIGSPAIDWRHVAVANNGNIIGSGVSGYSTAVYVRKDTGEGFDWYDTNVGNGTDKLVDISDDGERLIYAEASGYIYTTDMSDETAWGSQSEIGDWRSVSLNNDGSKVVAAGYLTEVWVGDYVAPDTTAPTVISVVPSNGAKNVAVDAQITINFSEPMYNGSLVPSTSPCEETCATYDTEWSEGYDSVILTKSNGPFKRGQRYTIGIDAQDVYGNPLAETYEWSFTTAGGGGSRSSTPESRSRSTGGTKSITPTVQTTSTSAPTTIAPIKTVTRDLEYGMTYSGVTILQQFLIDQMKGPAAQTLKDHGTTNYFGALTRAALAEWQKANGITPAQGYFGPKTRALIAQQV
ncbi:MAG: hypothetical protein RLY57_536 [Candidatus Parcubacteria bacterium]